MTCSDSSTHRVRESTATDSGPLAPGTHLLLRALIRLTRACDAALTLLDQPDRRGSDTTVVRVLSRCRTVAASGCRALVDGELPDDELLELLAFAAAAKAMLQRAADPRLERQTSECQAALAALCAATAAVPAAPLR